MMPLDELLACVTESLAAITAPRLFQTERGYQGALLAQLDQRLQLPDYAIVEQEYQKQANLHGLTIRPDIIIHEPFDPGRHGARTEGNLAVFELKLRATAAEALADFGSLESTLRVLGYRFGIFVNIDAAVTHAELVPANISGRIVCFAVALANGTVQIIQER
jgi:hypothetical protein